MDVWIRVPCVCSLMDGSVMEGCVMGVWVRGVLLCVCVCSVMDG